MTFTRENENVTLEMTVREYKYLLLMLGYAIGAAFGQKDKPMADSMLNFVKDLAGTDPDFTPNTIPEEYDSAAPRPQKTQ